MKISGVVESYGSSNDYSEIIIKIKDIEGVDLMRLVGSKVVVNLDEN